jgi:hypothetical protein
MLLGLSWGVRLVLTTTSKNTHLTLKYYRFEKHVRTRVTPARLGKGLSCAVSNLLNQHDCQGCRTPPHRLPEMRQKCLRRQFSEREIYQSRHSKPIEDIQAKLAKPDS